MTTPSATNGSTSFQQLNPAGWACLWEGCNAVLPTSDQLRSHLNYFHIGTVASRNRCLECRWQGCERQGRPFKTRSNAVSHIDCHIEDRTYSCEICGICFKRQADRAKHWATIHGLDKSVILEKKRQAAEALQHPEQGFVRPRLTYSNGSHSSVDSYGAYSPFMTNDPVRVAPFPYLPNPASVPLVQGQSTTNQSGNESMSSSLLSDARLLMASAATAHAGNSTYSGSGSGNQPIYPYHSSAGQQSNQPNNISSYMPSSSNNQAVSTVPSNSSSNLNITQGLASPTTAFPDIPSSIPSTNHHAFSGYLDTGVSGDPSSTATDGSMDRTSSLLLLLNEARNQDDRFVILARELSYLAGEVGGIQIRLNPQSTTEQQKAGVSLEQADQLERQLRTLISSMKTTIAPYVSSTASRYPS